jgi:hypothetical protein
MTPEFRFRNKSGAVKATVQIPSRALRLTNKVNAAVRRSPQIHRSDPISVIEQERLPTLRRWFSSFDHIFGHTRLSDIDSELEQLSVDPRRPPQRIGDAHLADKLAYLRYSWSATTAPRLPAPIRSEAGAVPFYDGLRLHNRQCV